uniref:Uncharacterized protein n=1 Tax=Anguilla anguilla TaxID=7936 RepID=A0A0E9R7F0_ANGAN
MTAMGCWWVTKRALSIYTQLSVQGSED